MTTTEQEEIAIRSQHAAEAGQSKGALLARGEEIAALPATPERDAFWAEIAARVEAILGSVGTRAPRDGADRAPTAACWCGSGKKYGACHSREDYEIRAAIDRNVPVPEAEVAVAAWRCVGFTNHIIKPKNAAPASNTTCRCGAPAIELFSSFTCLRPTGCGPVPELEPPSVEPAVLVEVWTREQKLAPLEHGWRAHGHGRCAEHPTREGAIAAWKALR